MRQLKGRLSQGYYPCHINNLNQALNKNRRVVLVSSFLRMTLHKSDWHIFWSSWWHCNFAIEKWPWNHPVVLSLKTFLSILLAVMIVLWQNNRFLSLLIHRSSFGDNVVKLCIERTTKLFTTSCYSEVWHFVHVVSDKLYCLVSKVGSMIMFVPSLSVKYL